jgi:BirA family transcriptional regulator, biotin operon repressor / biotin---[acetyl-CoA-carboxylase] ligase
MPSPIDADRLRAALIAYPVIDVVATTTSTNADLATAARTGAADRTVLIADAQTAGQGRRARDWVSPPGSGIYLSVLLRPSVPPSRLAWLTMMAGVALVRTARWAGARDAVLKWPNDLLLGPDRRKAAGILAEVGGTAVVLGIGLNVLPLPSTVPLGPGGLAATSLADAGANRLDRTDLVIRLLSELADLEDAWRAAAGDPAAGGYAEYVACCGTIGERVRVDLPDTAIEGIAEGVEPGGGLLVRTDGDIVRPVSAGDVVHLRPADRS